MAGDERDSLSERRRHERFRVHVEVEYGSGDNFLFSYLTNISEMGIFIRSDEPLPIGTELLLRFGAGATDRFELEGEVVWINPVKPHGNINPGMGVRFRHLTPEQRERVVDLVRTVAYLQDDAGD